MMMNAAIAANPSKSNICMVVYSSRRVEHPP